MIPALAQETLGFSGGSQAQKPFPEETDNFHRLVAELSSILGPSSGLTSDDVDVAHLEQLMEDYVSNSSEWQKYAFADFSRGYTRNLVDEGNGKSNLLVLVWTPGKGSPIHDHANAHCLMKVLKGTLCETRYRYPANVGEGPQVIKETVFKAGQVTYMSDELGLHRISNLDPNGVSVSLHLYTPPNAAREGCNIFCEKTGKSSHVTQCNFYSIFGNKVGQ